MIEVAQYISKYSLGAFYFSTDTKYYQFMILQYLYKKNHQTTIARLTKHEKIIPYSREPRCFSMDSLSLNESKVFSLSAVDDVGLRGASSSIAI